MKAEVIHGKLKISRRDHFQWEEVFVTNPTASPVTAIYSIETADCRENMLQPRSRERRIAVIVKFRNMFGYQYRFHLQEGESALLLEEPIAYKTLQGNVSLKGRPETRYNELAQLVYRDAPHPEQAEDELFLTNIWPSSYTTLPELGQGQNFVSGGSKRLGDVGYDTDGNPLQKGRPVFIKISACSPEVLKTLREQGKDCYHPRKDNS
jgi:hypothetical protein